MEIERSETPQIEPRRPYPVESQPDRSDIHLADIARGLYRNRWMVIGIAVAVIVAAAVFTFFQTPEYESEATVQIHLERTARSGALADLGAAIGLANFASRDAARIGTDMLVMQSRGIIEHIADSLTLHVQMTEPQAARISVFSAVDAPRNVVPATVELQYRGDGEYAVGVMPASENPPRRQPGPQDPSWDPEAAWRELFEHTERVEIGQPFEIGNVAFTLNPALVEEPPDHITVEIRDFRSTVQAVRTNLDIGLAESGTQIILVGYRYHDPVLVAAVPNAITSSFIRHKIETSQAENRSRGDFLRKQVANYAGLVEDAEARLQAFREQEQIINAPAQATEQVSHYAELLSQRDEIQQERDALQRLLSRLSNEEMSSDSARETYRELAAFPVFFANGAIQDIIRSLIELENERADLMIQRTEQSIDIRGIDTRVRELELQLLETAEDYLASRENQLTSLNAVLSKMADLAEEVPAREVELARLTREQELLTEIYSQLQLRLHEVEVEEAVEPLDVQLLDPALVPNRPASPRPILNLILGVLLGIALGLLVAFARQIVDTKVRSRNDVQIAVAGLPVMATIPRIGPVSDGRVNNGRLRLRRLRRARPELGRISPLVARDAPRSPAAEAYRALRTRVFFRRDGDAPRVLIVTSAAAGEGKSTSAANLAVTLSNQGMATLLIDGDLRRGTLHEIFGTDRAPGLGEVLQGKFELGDALQSIDLADGRLDILPSGAHPENPSELIGGHRMELMLQDLIDRYDRILIDSPPLRFATDAAVLCSMPNTGALMVARAGFSDRHALEDVARELQEMGIRVDGVIINDVDLSEGPAYGYRPAYSG